MCTSRRDLAHSLQVLKFLIRQAKVLLVLLSGCGTVDELSRRQLLLVSCLSLGLCDLLLLLTRASSW